MNFILVLLLSAGLVLIECLIGGTRLLFSFPSYAMFAAAGVLSIFALRRAISTPSLVCLCSTLALALWVMARAWVSPIPYLAWPDLTMAAACLLVYLLTALYLTESRFRLLLVIVLFAIAALEIGVGVIQFGKDNHFMLFGFIRRDTIERASGMFISGNHFAGYLESIAMFALALTFWGRWPIPARICTGYLGLMCFVGVIISGSRGGCLSSVIGVAALCALSLWMVHIINPKRTMTLLVVSALSAAVVIGVAGTVMLQSRLIRTRVNLDHTHDVRIYNWAAAIDQFRLSPWIGTGSGTHLIFGRLYRRPAIQADPVHAHGDYLEMLAEYGLAGELLALVFLGTHLVNGFQAAGQIATRRLRNTIERPTSDTLALTLGAFSAVAALMAHSVVDFNMHIPGNAIVFAFIFGMLANPGVDRPAAAPGWLSAITGLRLALLPAGAALIVFTVPKIKGEQRSEEARIALRNKKNTEVINLAKQAIAAQPLNSSNYFYLGEANRALGLMIGMPAIRQIYFENALKAYEDGLKCFPQDDNLLVRCAQVLDGLGRFDQAEEKFQEAMKWDPKLGMLKAHYAVHLHLMGLLDAEKQARAEAQKLAATDISQVGVAEVHALLGEPRKRPVSAEDYLLQAP